ncbi:hypothetical protein pb186bvf_004128 [Paramecium bursaria]
MIFQLGREIFFIKMIMEKMKIEWILKFNCQPGYQMACCLMTLYLIVDIFLVENFDWLIIMKVSFYIAELTLQIVWYYKKCKYQIWDIQLLLQFIFVLLLSNRNDGIDLYFSLICVNMSTSFGVVIAIALRLSLQTINNAQIVFLLVFTMQNIYKRYSQIKKLNGDIQDNQEGQIIGQLLSKLAEETQQGVVFMSISDIKHNKIDQQSTHKLTCQWLSKLPIRVYHLERNSLFDNYQIEKIYGQKSSYTNLNTFLIQMLEQKIDYNCQYFILAKNKETQQQYQLSITKLENHGQVEYAIIYSRLNKEYFYKKLIPCQTKYFQIISNTMTHKLKTNLSAAITHLKAALLDKRISQEIINTYILPSYQNCQIQYYQVQDIIDFMTQDVEHQGSSNASDIVQIALKAIELVIRPCQSKQITIKLTINGEDYDEHTKSSFMTDENKLIRVLINLLNNAYRFTQQGGQITLDINLEENDKAIFKLEDTGYGISDELCDNLNREMRQHRHSSFGSAMSLLNKNNPPQYQGFSLFVTNNLVKQLNNQNQPLQIDNTNKTKFYFFIENIIEQASAVAIKSVKNLDNYRLNRNSNSFKLQQINKSQIFSPSANSDNNSVFDINEEPACNELTQLKINTGFQRKGKPSIQLKSSESPIYQFLKRQRASICQKKKTQIHISDANRGSFGLINIQFSNTIESQLNDEGYILIVDDEPFNHVSIKMMLRQIKIFNTKSAFNGQECLDIIMSNKDNIRLVLMDVDMPIMDGIQATKIITKKQQSNEIKDFPIVACTAHQDQATHEMCLDVGMIAILQKPVFQKSLYEILQLLEESIDSQLLSRLKFTSTKITFLFCFVFFILFLQIDNDQQFHQKNTIKKNMLREYLIKQLTPNYFPVWSLSITIMLIVYTMTDQIRDWLYFVNLSLNIILVVIQILWHMKGYKSPYWDILILGQFICSNLLYFEQKKLFIYYCLMSYNVSTPLGLILGLILQLICLKGYLFEQIISILFCSQTLFIRFQEFSRQAKQKFEKQSELNQLIVTKLFNNPTQGIVIIPHDDLKKEKIQQQRQLKNMINKILDLPLNVYLVLDDLNKSVDRPNELTYQKTKYTNLFEYLSFLLQTGSEIQSQQKLIIKDKNQKYILNINQIEQDGLKYFLVNYSSAQSNFLQEKLIQKQQQFQKLLLGSLTHKLKTPLSSAIIHLQAALKEEQISEATKRIYIQPAYNNCQLQLYLVQDVIDYLSWDFEKVQACSQNIDIIKIVQDNIKLIQHACDLKQIELIFTVNQQIKPQHEKFQIVTDENKLSRILVNLLNNAYRFTQPGGRIHLDIETTIQNIAQFTIEDTGCAITDEQLNSLNYELNNSHRGSYSQRKSSPNKDQGHKYQGISLQIANKLIKLLNNQDKSLQFDNNNRTRFTFFIESLQQDNQSLQIKSLNNIDLYKQLRSSVSSNARSNAVSIFSKPGRSSHHQKYQDIQDKSYNDDISDEPSHHELIKFPAIQRYKKKDQQERAQFIERKILTRNLTYRKTAIKQMARNSIQKNISSFGFIQQLEQERQLGFILIVDDEPFNHVSLTMMLKQIKITDIKSSYNGQQCIDVILENQKNVRLVLMDVDMPIMDGISATIVITEKQTRGELRYFPIVGCTAHQDQETHKKCLDAGMLTILQKPVFQKSLYDTIKSTQEKQFTNILIQYIIIFIFNKKIILILILTILYYLIKIILDD